MGGVVSERELERERESERDQNNIKMTAVDSDK